MSVELIEDHEGKVLTVRATGKLAAEDYDHFLPEIERLIKQQQAAEQDAQHTIGVQRVKNNLRVRWPEETPSDEQIAGCTGLQLESFLVFPGTAAPYASIIIELPWQRAQVCHSFPSQRLILIAVA